MGKIPTEKAVFNNPRYSHSEVSSFLLILSTEIPSFVPVLFVMKARKAYMELSRRIYVIVRIPTKNYQYSNNFQHF